MPTVNSTCPAPKPAPSLIGGMTTATIFTLLVVPIFYTFFDDARLAFLRLLRRAVGREASESRRGVAATDTLRAG